MAFDLEKALAHADELALEILSHNAECLAKRAHSEGSDFVLSNLEVRALGELRKVAREIRARREATAAGADRAAGLAQRQATAAKIKELLAEANGAAEPHVNALSGTEPPVAEPQKAALASAEPASANRAQRRAAQRASKKSGKRQLVAKA